MQDFKTWFDCYKAFFSHIGGQNEIANYQKMCKYWNDIVTYYEKHSPQLKKTIIDPPKLSVLMSSLKNRDLTKSPKSLKQFYTICGGQNTELGRKRGCWNLGLFGFYSFYNKQSSAHVMPWKQFQKIIQDKYIFVCGIPPGGYIQNNRDLITIPTYVTIDKQDGAVYSHSHNLNYGKFKLANSLVDYLAWFRNELYNNNFTIEQDGSIDRYPKIDPIDR
eukprot:UN24195